MSKPPKILALSGSTRSESWNTRLLQQGIQGLHQTGVEVTALDLADYPMPLYDGDIETEEGHPEAARALKAQMIAHDGFLIASPEYNGFFTPLLKNAIDWTSRPAPGEPSLVAFRGKVAGLIAASPGTLGGLRGLGPLRQLLSGIGVLVIPEQFALRGAASAFDASGALTEDANRQGLRNVTDSLARVSARLAN